MIAHIFRSPMLFNHLSTFALILVTVLTWSCSADDADPPKPQSSSINTIMPLGASRVEGNRPEFESFRYELWKNLVEGGYTFDFIGTQTDGASYLEFEGRTFDTDHEGRGGWTSSQILEGIESWINAAGAPDIVLFSSPGGNDILNGASIEATLANVNAIIDVIQEANPNVTILIEQLAPLRSDLTTTAETIAIAQAQQVIAAIATTQTTTSSQVIPVDMFTGFTDDFLADEVHYNQAGAEFIANRYFTALVRVLDNPSE
ncbi:GDSL-type esterase/lipase family protein [Maribacter sp. 2307UL18-2]|uniref:GDSL-type esterase/lipase family protein n=1 Tax=Maribacter sp. 2307UL18-2 TaxID=3386274 RepID=UPI0039BC872D